MGTGDRGVLVIGPGAIGAWTAARLAHAGHDVTVACRSKESAQHILRHGVTGQDVKGGPITAHVAAMHRPGKPAIRPDLVVHATKCAAAPAAWKSWRRHLPKDAPLVAVQNGLMGDALAPLADDRLVLGTVAFPATRTGVGASQRTGPGGYLLGAWPPRQGPDAHAATAQAILADAAPAEVVPDIRGVQWTKLLVNSCITSLGALSGASLGELLKDRRARHAFLDISTEGYRAGCAEGVDFVPIDRFDPARMADRRDGQVRALRMAMLRLAAAKYRRHRSSSLQSLERGEATEVDYLNGAIVAAGRRHDVPTPVNETMLELIHEVEAGGLTPSPDHLDALPRR